MDDVCGFAYIFLLLGPACTAITEWSELQSPESMMDALTKTLATPTRISEPELKAQKETQRRINTVKLGTMSFATPNNDTWILATKTADDMHELAAEYSLGTKTKFYNKIIDAKGNKAVRDLQYTKETIDVTSKVTKMLKNAKNIDKKIGINVIKKLIAANTFAILKKRDTSIKFTSTALGGNKNKDNETPKTSLTTTIKNKNNNDNNNNTNDNMKPSDEATAKRMREVRKEKEQQQQQTPQPNNSNNNSNTNYNNNNYHRYDRGRGRGNGRGGGNIQGGGRGWNGRPAGRGGEIINTYRRNYKRQGQGEQDTMNKWQKY
jgi:hypothetical protein